MQTYRGPPSDWTSPPSAYSPAPSYGGSTPTNFQLILEDAEFSYDNVDNPTEIHDWRSASEWPSGAKPVSRKIQYDDLYRVSQVDYQYSAGDDTWVDPFDAEDTGKSTDTRRAKPSPHVSFDKRALRQTFQYDWLGNTTSTGDDANGFYDRSLGGITNDSAKPYQLKSASNEATASPRSGHLDTVYDDAGNLTSLSVARAGTCLPSASNCNQRFAYDWDEVGRLVRARRWDQPISGSATDPIPSTTPDVDLAYAYDGGDERVLKTATDSSNNQVHTVYIFGSLELRRATYDGTDYTDDKTTEVPYLFAHGVRLARLHYSEESLPTLTSGKLHVLLEMPDHLGSSAMVVDRETSELVERGTYLAQGVADSDYRTDRWDSFREDHRFTGKEEDVEVGVEYFGARYFAPGLGRWMSADPLTVHSLGADLNPYAYVHGRWLSATDPLGLEDVPPGATDVQQHGNGYFSYHPQGAPSNYLEIGEAGPTTFGYHDPGTTAAPVTGSPAPAGMCTASGDTGAQPRTYPASSPTPAVTRYDAAAAQRNADREELENLRNSFVLSAADGVLPSAAYTFARASGDDLGQAAKLVGVATLASELGGAVAAAQKGSASANLVQKAPRAGRGGTTVTPGGDEVTYHGTDSSGRPQGVDAELTARSLGTGTKANPGILPPGFGGRAAGHARAHLLARLLGGSGYDVRNIVTLFQTPANSPVMRDFEAQVADALRAGEGVKFSATPIYVGSEPAPRGITLSAAGSGGFQLDVTVVNQGSR